MLNFMNDYSEAACPEILKKITETSLDKNLPYGMDSYCASAQEKIRKECNCPEAQVYFLTAGTQTNMLVIDCMLKPYEGVIAPVTGHTNNYEAGAVEFTGHKVLSIPEYNGKLTAADVDDYIKAFYADDSHDHMVFPGIVYISHPTELGTLYTREELAALHEVCSSYNIPLFADGARMGYGLMAQGTDVTLEVLAKYCDVFYIGGTKVGALYGEALVFTKNNMPERFSTRVKQHGAMVSKGWLIGMQFDVLFTDDLYYRLGANAIQTAAQIKKALAEKGYEFFIDSPTNLIFIVLENEKCRELTSKVRLDYWGKIDDSHVVMRIATSWATTQEQVDALINVL
ncbi:MAG: threonine aldolase family protein [Lachnospiraceae bacterium]|jgi:threonine aldolase